MGRCPVGLVLLALASAGLASGHALARDLTFDERVAAQKAIERIYYSHQTGTTLPFEESVSRAVLENKVDTYLKKSVALDQFWHTPITGEMLQREMIRIAQNTRFPNRLQEIYAALGNDSFLMQECLARPALVDRLTRSFFSSDERIHAATRAEAESLRTRLADGEVSPLEDAPNRTVVPAERDSDASDLAAADIHGTQGRSVAGAPNGAPAARALLDIDGTGVRREGSDAPHSVTAIFAEAQDAFVVRAPLPDDSEASRLAVYTFPKVPWDSWWSLHRDDFDPPSTAPVAGDSLEVATAMASLGTDNLDCIAGDTWSNGSMNPAIPDARSGHVAVWTGSLMVIWGGSVEGDFPNRTTNTGGRYDPLIDQWMPMSTDGAPQASAGATAIWTGHEMIVWGGRGGPNGLTALGSGGRYDPVQNTWSPVSTLGSPSARYSHTAVWTGDRMIVHGGFETSGQTTFTGGRYDPATDTWFTMSINSNLKRALHQAVWTGRVMIVWGGLTQYFNAGPWPSEGGLYDPVTDTWQPTATLDAPVGRDTFSAVWTGSEMVIQGGFGTCIPNPQFPFFCAQPVLRSGGRYDPVLNRWRPMSTLNSPRNDPGQAAVWTGQEMLIWGSFGGNDGGLYDPVSDQWTPISTVNAPPYRRFNTAVWTGEQMIVWGGSLLPDGGRYDLASDTWTPTSMPTFVAPRVRSSSVWTGSEMIFWGGNSAVSRYYATNEGSRYDPLLDQWSPTSTANAPDRREHFLAVWTGSSMVIWGGNLDLNSNYPLNTGGRYDPRSDSWSATSSMGAPTARSDSSAVWTGSSMIVWGGALYGGSPTNTGALYDPVANRWTPVSMLDAPAARSRHTAVWTGTEMVVWGGASGSELNTGGRYDPVLDRWTPTATLNAPTPRQDHSSVWTGTRVLIWGGAAGPQGMSSGALYNPAQDSWQGMSATGAPSARMGQTAIWTGREMVVWGGQGNNQPLNTGGRYDPSRDQWMPTNIHGAPEARGDHTAVWTGEMMIIWGGPYSRTVATGGRYLPYLTGQQVAADAGTDMVAECGSPTGTAVTLSGAGSSCSDSANLNYSWSGPFTEGGGAVEGDAPTVTLPLGTSTLTLLVDDGLGHSATDTMTVTVHDTTPPQLSIGLSSAILWPPNHRMVDIAASLNAIDACSVPTVSLASITSTEPDDAPVPGDGNTSDDIQGADTGTADSSFQLRAERDGNGPGRAYTVSYTAVDGSGNPSQTHAFVVVPHDLGGTTEPLDLSVQESLAGTLLHWNAVAGATAYSVIRGNVRSLQMAGDFIDLGTVRCVRSNSPQASTSGQEDGEIPAPGEAFFYLAQYNDGRDSGYGSASAAKPRISTAGGCP